MAAVAKRSAVRADQALAHGVEVAEGLLVFGASAFAAVLDAAAAASLELEQYEIFRQ